MAVSPNRRKIMSIALGTCLLVLFACFVRLNAFNKSFLDPVTTKLVFIYTGLSVVAVGWSLPESAVTQAQAGSRRQSGRLSAHGNAASAGRQSREALSRILRQREITLQNGFAIVYRDKRAVASFQMPQRDGATAQVKTWLPEQRDRKSVV